MNSSVSVELLEQELLRTQDISFYFGFATTQYPELEIEKDKKHHHYINYTDSEHKEFYSRCEDICNMDVINIPLYNFIFSELAEAIMQVKNLKVNRNKQPKDTKERQSQARREPIQRSQSDTDFLGSS